MIKAIGKRCLPLFLALVMLLSLMPMTTMAASVPGVSVTNLSTDTSGGTWSNYDSKTNAIQGKVYGKDGSWGCDSSTTNDTTLTLKNTGTIPARLTFTYSVLFDKDSRDDSHGRLVLGGTTVSSGENKTGNISVALQPNATYVISMTSERGNSYYGQLTMENIKLTPFYAVKWSVNGRVVETDYVDPESVTYPEYNGSTPTTPDIHGNARSFLGWSADPNATSGQSQTSALGRVTGDVTYYAIFTSTEIFPVQDPDPSPTAYDVANNTHIENPGRVNQNGLKLSKEVETEDGQNFDIKMESYSTANTSLMNVTEKVPTDFVVIVDQSGSMKENDMMVGTPTAVSGSKTLEEIAEGNYYIKGDDGNYYRVYGVRDYLYRYYAPNYWYVGDIVKRFDTNLGWFMSETDDTYTLENQFYFRETDANGKGVYHPITTSVEGKIGTYYMRFWYTNNAGQTVNFNRETETYVGTNCPYYHNVINGNTIGPGWGIWPVNYNNVDGIVQGLYPNDNAYTYSEIEILGAHTGMLVNYPMYDRHIGYVELRYRDVNGAEHTVKPVSGSDRAEYCNANGQAITTASGSTRYNYNNLYQASSTQTRLAALQTALTQFVTAVANESDTKTGSVGSVDNRIAIVGFSSDSSSTYMNTELLTGSTFSITKGSSIPANAGTSFDGYNYNGKQMSEATNADYAGALIKVNVDEKVGTVNSKLTDAIQAVTAYGGTQPEKGFEMAKNIFTNRGTGEGKTKYTMETGTSAGTQVDRNTIVIYFTDGQPGDYHYSNQYTEANEVVAAAKQVKDLGVQVFSIGVFGESDGNPLTYNETNLKSPYNNSKYWPYMGGYVETYTEGGSEYCLRRQWRPAGANPADKYTAVANDTIFDYMSVVSSNYPSATQYIAPAWLSGNYTGANGYTGATEGVRGANVGSNQFYRMASSQATLVAAFAQAVTHASTISTSSSSIVLNTTSVFKDTVNTTDFDVENATYTVYRQPITLDETVGANQSMVKEVGDPVEIQAARPVPANGVITYSGFDFQNSYVAYGHPNGAKLVVKVEGLQPKTYGVDIKTNADTEGLNACGIYEYGKSTPAISIESPIVSVLKSASTYIADFNAPFIVATEVAADGIKDKDVKNGDFTRSNDGKVVYTLTTETQQAAAGTTVAINGIYNQADRANITGKHAEDGEHAVSQPRDVIVFPAGSIYYDDNLTTPIDFGDGSGYNEAVSESHATANMEKGKHTFTFYGTGIDVYCSTTTDGGYIQAMLDGNSDTVQTIRNYDKEITRYNVPSITFRDLAEGVQHTLVINVIGSSNYKLDGIRIYNPVSAENQSIYNDAAPEEQYAAFINMREALVNDNGVSQAFTDEMDNAVIGALFVDDTSRLGTEVPQYDNNGNPIMETVIGEDGNPVTDETGNPIQQPVMKPAYESTFDAYKANSPKNEIYLRQGQGVTFQLTQDALDAAEAGHLWIGLSAPDAETNFTNARVAINANTDDMIKITSAVDMYYPITMDLIGDTNSITISCEGSAMISVTNLKITGVQSIYNAANAPKGSTSSLNEPLAAVLSVEDVIPMVFEPVTMKTVRMAANNGVDPEDVVVPTEPETPAPTEEPVVTPEPTPDPTPAPTETPAPVVTPTPTQAPGVHDIVKQVVTSFVSSLFRSISRLFGN